jgi:ATP-binding cassette subfamily F protein 2
VGKNGTSSTTGSSTNTPLSSSTPMTNMSANTSVEDLPGGSEMAKLAISFDRSGSGVLTSDSQSRDIQAINYTLSFHGRVLIESGNLTLNYGQR